MRESKMLKFYFLRDKQFDSIFILLPMFVGIFSALICVWQPKAFLYILFMDFWLLAYHHVISSYTRIAFDWASIKSHSFLVFGLPLLVFSGVVGFYSSFGIWILVTISFYWQWYHYTRQSYGISRYYIAQERKPNNPLLHPIHTLALYFLPITGILYRSWQAPETFIFLKLWVIPVSYEIVIISAFLSIVFIAMQLCSWWKLHLVGTLNGSYVVYMTSHYAMFIIGHFLIDNINFGWLAMNVWHNMQYIIFVWLKNNQIYSGGVDYKHLLISKISQNGKMWLYILVCLGITLCIYIPLYYFTEKAQEGTTIAVAFIVFITINFHHYIVDSVIWKRKVIKA